MQNLTLRILIALLALAAGTCAVQADDPSVRDLMAPDDFTLSGLEKLSDEELAHLSAWVERYRSGTVDGPPPPPKRPSQMTVTERAEYEEQIQAEKNFEMAAKVIPAFNGWSGKTVFRLDNGQVWQQRQPGNLRYSEGESSVVITRNFFGRYVMTHTATGRSIGVRRLR
jgi:hypothetical protein